MATVAYPQDHFTVADERPLLAVRLHPVITLTDDQLYELAQINRELRIERNAQGELIIMPPTGSETGTRNAEITLQLGLWAKRDGTGLTFDSSSGFLLPNGAMRSPDAAWLKHTRWATLTPAQRKKFAPLCPDFVIELRSENDSLEKLQEKMQEYLDNGAQLGWLIDPLEKRAYIYRPGQAATLLQNPETLVGESVVSGFVLDLREVW